jgi:hypothetical protein
LIHCLSNAIGVNDPLRFRTISTPEYFSAGAWYTDTNPPAYGKLIDGNATSVVPVITFNDTSLSIVSKRFVVSFPMFRRPNFITIQSDYSNNFYGYSVGIEKQVFGAWLPAVTTQSVANGTARLLAFQLGDLLYTDALRFTFTVNQAITSGGALMINSIRSYSNQNYSSTIPVYINSGSQLITTNKVGIGTFVPANSLTVMGAASIGSTTYNTSAPTHGLIVQGKVGIGTTLPGPFLHVHTGSATPTSTYQVEISAAGPKRILFFANAVNGSYNPIVTQGASGIIFLSGSDGAGQNFFIAPWNSTIGGLMIRGSGQVGIGTTSPEVSLHIVGSGLAAGSSVRICNPTTAGTAGTSGAFPIQAVNNTPYGTLLKLSYDTSGIADYTVTRNYTTGILEFTGTQTSYVGYGFNLSGQGFGIGVLTPANRLHIDGGSPAAGTAGIRIDNAGYLTGVASNAKSTFFGYLPIKTSSTNTVYIQLWK